MVKQIFDKLINFLSEMFDKATVLISAILGFILSSIGYPKQVLVLIVGLIIFDTISKHYSIVVVNYGKFTIKNYFRAWKERNLTSRGMKNGFGTKALFYLPMLFLAHQASIIPELIGGTAISMVLYSIIIVIEGRSILENYEDAGFSKFSSIKKFFEKKEKDILSLSDEEASQGNKGLEIREGQEESVYSFWKGEENDEFGDKI